MEILRWIMKEDWKITLNASAYFPNAKPVLSFTLKFQDRADWEDFRTQLVKSKGVVRWNGSEWDHWSMQGWIVPGDRMSKYPLGRLWPDSIDVKMTEVQD